MYDGPLMMPGIPGVLLMARLRTALLNPQFREEYTLKVPVLHPARKFTVTLFEVVVSVLVPPLIVALPVTVHVYLSAPATAPTLYVLFVFAQPMILPLIAEGCVTRARTKRQAAGDCPQPLPANTQML